MLLRSTDARRVPAKRFVRPFDRPGVQVYRRTKSLSGGSQSWNQVGRDDCSLSPREEQVLDLLGKGNTTKDIAVSLDLSPATVSNHRKSICRKLDIHSTATLVYYATLRNK